MEFIVGGTILIALFILIAGVLWLKGAMIIVKTVNYSVLFPNVGTLHGGDAVVVNGVRKGKVESIGLRGSEVAVVIQVDKDVVLTDSAVVTVQNIGLMGERMVGIQLSSKGALLRPNDKKGQPAAYIQGRFDSGIAEAMGMLGSVLADVRGLVTNITGIVDSTVGDTAFFGRFHRIAARLDTITGMTERLIAENRPAINRGVAAAEKAAQGVNALVDANKDRISAIVSDGAELSSRMTQLAARADSLTRSIEAMVSGVNNGQGTLGRLVKDDQLYNELKKSIGDLDTLVKEVREDGLKVRIKIGFRKEKK